MTATAKKKTTKKPRTRSTTTGAKKPRRTLLPVMRPAQNMREILKQSIMLEDHLFQKCKRCPDCIRKHMLTMEGLAEECATLCAAENAALAEDAGQIAKEVRTLHHAWEQQPKDCGVARAVATELRKLRKALMAKYAALPIDSLPTDETHRVRTILKGSTVKGYIRRRKPT